MSWLSDALGTSRPNAPQLPAAPVYQAPQLPQYPGFSPQEQQILQQQQQGIGQFQNAISGYGQSPYAAQQGQVGNQEIQNYMNALTGQIAPNQMIAQQKAKDWQQTVEQAGQQGIRLSGDNPGSAVSQSTAGNQIISDFNKRYGALEQQYNLGQQQIGQQAYQGGMGLAQSGLGAQAGAYNAYQGQLGNLFNPYNQQTLGQFGVNTNQAMANTNTANQNALNQYNQQTAQTMANYNNALSGWQNQMGLISGALGGAAQLGSAYMASGGGGGGGGGSYGSVPTGGGQFGNSLSLNGGATYLPGQPAGGMSGMFPNLGQAARTLGPAMLAGA